MKMIRRQRRNTVDVVKVLIFVVLEVVIVVVTVGVVQQQQKQQQRSQNPAGTTTTIVSINALLLRSTTTSTTTSSKNNRNDIPIIPISQELGCSPTLSLFFTNQPNTKDDDDYDAINKRWLFGLSRRRRNNNNNPDNKKNSNKYYFFDPLQLGTDTNFMYYREAEYKHGRIAMIAMFEIMILPFVHQIYNDDSSFEIGNFCSVITENNNIINDGTTTAIDKGVRLSSSFVSSILTTTFCSRSTSHPFTLPPDHNIVQSSILHLSIEDIMKVVIACGILELFILRHHHQQKQQQPSTTTTTNSDNNNYHDNNNNLLLRMPGDYGIGYFGVHDYSIHESELQMELEHGRLAMISFVLYILLDIQYYHDMSWYDHLVLQAIPEWITTVR